MSKPGISFQTASPLGLNWSAKRPRPAMSLGPIFVFTRSTATPYHGVDYDGSVVEEAALDRKNSLAALDGVPFPTPALIYQEERLLAASSRLASLRSNGECKVLYS